MLTIIKTRKQHIIKTLNFAESTAQTQERPHMHAHTHTHTHTHTHNFQVIRSALSYSGRHVICVDNMQGEMKFFS